VSDASSCSASGVPAVRRRLIVDEHADRQALDRADGLARVADGLVDLEVARRGARHALRLRGCVGCGIRAVGASRARGCATRLRRDLRRLVAERAGHALHAFATVRVLARLLAAHDLDARVEALTRLLRDRKVELGRNARAHALGADDRAEQALDAARVLLLELLAIFELRARQARGIVR
jgi:hypothetical protein